MEPIRYTVTKNVSTLIYESIIHGKLCTICIVALDVLISLQGEKEEPSATKEIISSLSMSTSIWYPIFFSISER